MAVCVNDAAAQVSCLFIVCLEVWNKDCLCGFVKIINELIWT